MNRMPLYLGYRWIAISSLVLASIMLTTIAITIEFGVDALFGRMDFRPALLPADDIESTRNALFYVTGLFNQNVKTHALGIVLMVLVCAVGLAISLANAWVAVRLWRRFQGQGDGEADKRSS